MTAGSQVTGMIRKFDWSSWMPNPFPKIPGDSFKNKYLAEDSEEDIVYFPVFSDCKGLMASFFIWILKYQMSTEGVTRQNHESCLYGNICYPYHFLGWLHKKKSHHWKEANHWVGSCRSLDLCSVKWVMPARGYDMQLYISGHRYIQQSMPRTRQR